MNIQPLNCNVNYLAKKSSKRKAEAALAMLLLLQPVKNTAYADNATLNNVSQEINFSEIYKDAKTRPDDYRVVEYSDLYFAIISDGGKNELKAHYDSGKKGAGYYYQYGNEAFTKDEGKRINNPEKLRGFESGNQTIKPVTTPKPTPKPTPTPAVQCYYPPVWYIMPTPKPTPTTPKVDSRAPKGSDFYYAVLYYGDKYKIKSHFDAGAGGIGIYYQYGPYAYDKEGNFIINPEKLYGFDEDVK